MSPFGRGFHWGLAAGSLWLLGEAIWIASHHDNITAAFIPLHFGVAAPWIMVSAAVAGFAASGLLPWLARRGVSEESVQAWLLGKPSDHRTPDDVRRSTALVCAALLLSGVLVVATVIAGVRIWAVVRTPALAVALLLLIQGIVLGLLILLAPATIERIDRVLRLAPTAVARPLAPFAVLGMLGVAGFALAYWRYTNVIEHLPWMFAFTPAVGVLFATAIELTARKSLSARRRVAWLQRLVLLAVVCCLLWSLVAIERFDPRRSMLLSNASVGRVCLGLSRRVLDFDGDGALSFYGEGDCRPFDEMSGPHRIEIPRNGIDEDCSGRDLTIDGSAARRGQSHHPQPKGVVKLPHIFVITTDALSFRHTGLGGYQRPVTPRLDAWAKRATVFSHAFSVGPETATSFPALFTGVYSSTIPQLHPRVWRPGKAMHYPATLALALKQHGYRTHAIVGNEFLLGKSWPGITRGFDHVDGQAIEEARKRYSVPKPHTSPELTDHAIAFLKKHGDAPLMMWVHYFDHHPFYIVPRGETPFGDGKAPLDRYDTELRFSDRHWGRLFEAIEESFEPNEYIVLFTADHGEAFDANHPGNGEHHAHCLRTEENNVPFIVQGPARRGARIEGLVSLLDVVPTLVDIVGAKMPHALAGESLVPVLFDGKEVAKNVIFTHFYDPLEKHNSGFAIQQIAVRTPELFYIHDRQNHLRGLYRWRQDPLDRNDCAAAEPEQAEWLRFLAASELQRMLQPLE